VSSIGKEGGVGLPNIGGLESITEYYNEKQLKENGQRKLATAAGTTRHPKNMLQTI